MNEDLAEPAKLVTMQKDLYASGKSPLGPAAQHGGHTPRPRPSDFVPGASVALGTVGPEVPPTPSGMSSFDTVDDLLAGLGGPPNSTHVYGIAAGTQLPPGINIAVDGDLVIGNQSIPHGHNTIYPEVQLPWNEFRDGIANLPWAYQGKH